MSILKIKSVSLYKTILIIATVLFSVLLLLSIFFRYKETNSTEANPDPDELIAYTSLFLEGQTKEKTGRWLDCSGFTRNVYKKYSIRIPANSYEQFMQYGGLPFEKLQKGDLVFFNTSGDKVSHVGIFIENDLFIHSPGHSRFVRIDSLTHSYYEKCFVSGGRVIFDN